MWSVKTSVWSVSGLREITSILCMSEPPLVHFPHELLSDRIAGGIADDRADVAVRANGRGLLVRYIVSDFRGWEDTAAGEAAALLRPLYLFPVAETGVVRQLKLKFINEFSRMRVVAWRDSFSIISIFLTSRLLDELVVTETLYFQLMSWSLIGIRVAPFQALSHASLRQVVHHCAEYVLDIILLGVERGLHIVAQFISVLEAASLSASSSVVIERP